MVIHNLQYGIRQLTMEIFIFVWLKWDTPICLVNSIWPIIRWIQSRGCRGRDRMV